MRLRSLSALGLQWIAPLAVIAWLGACGGETVSGGSDGGGASGGNGGSAALGGTVGGGGSPSGGGGAPTGGGGVVTGGGGAPTGGGAGGMSCNPVGGVPGDCKPFDMKDPCQLCVLAKCCVEWQACAVSKPDDPCFSGGPAGEGEIFCFQTCFAAAIAGGVDPNDAKPSCAGKCATPQCGTISSATNDLIACLDTNCFTECFLP